MFIRDLNGEIRLGNSLINKIDKRWIIRKGGFIWEDDNPKVFQEPKQIKEESVLKPITEIQQNLL